MSRAFLNRNSQNHSNSQQSNSSQQKVDYEAQMKKLDMDINNPGWNTTDISPAQMFAEEEEEKQAKANEEEELQMKPKEKEELQKKEDTNNPGTKTSMPDDVQNKKENSFGIDFSDVNIHKDSEQAPNLSALAYTQDNDIHFVPGQYNPGSQEGQKQKRIHPVEAGETLGDLAEKFDTTPEAIKAANPGLQVDSNGNKEWYRKGDKIQLPKQKNIFNLLMKLGNNYSVKTYKVEKGKTLQDIASQFNTTPAKLKQLNPNVPGKFEGDIQWFNAGEIIKVPPKKSPETQIQELFNEYEQDDISAPELAAAMKSYATHHGKVVKQQINKLDKNKQDNVAYAFTNKSELSELFRFDHELLRQMADSLGGIFNTMSWFENREQRTRILQVLNDPQAKIVREINQYMNHERLTPEQIKGVRDDISLLDDQELQESYYRELQSKVKYENQRDSEIKEDGLQVEGKWGGICNLTSLAMVLQYLGISNPHPNLQYEDALEKVRQDNNFGPRTWASGWSKVAEKLGAEVTMLSGKAARDKSWWMTVVLSDIQLGKGIMMSIQGHIVRLQNVTNEGLVVDDPYGRLNLKERKQNNYSGGYEAYNNSDWSTNNEEENAGEDNVWPWEHVEKYVMRWIASFNE